MLNRQVIVKEGDDYSAMYNACMYLCEILDVCTDFVNSRDG